VCAPQRDRLAQPREHGEMLRILEAVIGQQIGEALVGRDLDRLGRHRGGEPRADLAARGE